MGTELKKEVCLRKELELKLDQTKQTEIPRRFFHIKRPDREVLEMRHNAIANQIILNLHGVQSGIVRDALRDGFFLRRDYTSLVKAFSWLTGLHKEPINWHEFHEWLYTLLMCKHYM